MHQVPVRQRHNLKVPIQMLLLALRRLPDPPCLFAQHSVQVHFLLTFALGDAGAGVHVVDESRKTASRALPHPQLPLDDPPPLCGERLRPAESAEQIRLRSEQIRG